MCLSLAGCGEVALTQSGTLSRYSSLTQTKDIGTSGRIYVDPARLVGMRTVRILPAVFPGDLPGAAELTPAERRLAANNADRALCYELSLKYDVVSTQDADFTVRSRVTRVVPTNLYGTGSAIGLAGVVTIAGHIGSTFAESVGRIPIPRLPIGLGSLTVEAEALDRNREQLAAMVWGSAANSFTDRARFSKVSDAYDLAGDFGRDFGFMLATGQNPFKAPVYIPNWNRIRVTMLGEAPLDPDCAIFGHSPGLDGILADQIGLPPDYGDKGPTAER